MKPLNEKLLLEVFPNTIEHLVKQTHPWDTAYTMDTYQFGDRITFKFDGRIATGVVMKNANPNDSVIEIGDVANIPTISKTDIILIPRRGCEWIHKDMTIHRGFPGEVLVGRDNEVLCYNELYDNVWGPNDIKNPNIAFISNPTQTLPLERIIAVDVASRGRRYVLLEEGMYVRLNHKNLFLSDDLYRVCYIPFKESDSGLYVLLSECHDIKIPINIMFVNTRFQIEPDIKHLYIKHVYQSESDARQLWKKYLDYIPLMFPPDNIQSSDIIEVWSMNGFVDDWDNVPRWFDPAVLSLIYKKQV